MFLFYINKNHPDVNKNPKAHREFLKIQEAYNVLSKSASRASYDLSLSNPYYSYENASSNVKSTYPGAHEQRGKDPWNDPIFYHNRPRSTTYNEDHPYYGIKGINKVSNGTVALIIITITIVSFLGQMLAINYSFKLQGNKMRKRSQETQETLNDIQERANRNGNELQIEILRRHFEEEERQRNKIRQVRD